MVQQREAAGRHQQCRFRMDLQRNITGGLNAESRSPEMGKSLQIITITLAIFIAAAMQFSMLGIPVSMAGTIATDNVACTRKSHSSLGFTSTRAFDAWFPKAIYFHHKAAQPAKRGRLTFGDKSGYYIKDGKSYWLASNLEWEMLPDGRLFAHFPQKSGYAQIETQRYECSETVAEILAKR
jgi:hypothetical protein